MTDRDKVGRAPERVWAQPETIGPCAGWDYEGTWHICEGANGGVEFVRADLYTALQADRDKVGRKSLIDSLLLGKVGDVALIILIIALILVLISIVGNVLISAWTSILQSLVESCL